MELDADCLQRFDCFRIVAFFFDRVFIDISQSLSLDRTSGVTYLLVFFDGSVEFKSFEGCVT